VGKGSGYSDCNGAVPSLKGELTRSKEHLKALQADLREAMGAIEEAEAGLEEVQCMLELIEESGRDCRPRNKKRKNGGLDAMDVGEEGVMASVCSESVSSATAMLLGGVSGQDLIGKVSAKKEAQKVQVEARVAELRSELRLANEEHERIARQVI